MEPRFIFLQLSATWVSPLTRIALFSNISPASVKSAILNCVESIFCHYLSEDTSKTLISAFVLSRIDYCNFLLAGCPKQLIHKLQKVQNNAARLICRTPKFDHVSPVLHTLHWLPVEQVIEYKLLLLAFKSVNKDGPSYLSDLLKFYIPSRQLRSSSDIPLLRIPSFRLKFF